MPALHSLELALAELYRGNARFAEGHAAFPPRAGEQMPAKSDWRPVAAILSCAELRVPIERIFDQGSGTFYGVTVAGNVADSATIASLEFATETLGVEVVMVLGHAKCGAVAAAMAAELARQESSALQPYLCQAAREGQGDLARAVWRNVQLQAGVLLDASAVLRQCVQQSQLLIAAGVYDLHSRQVTPVPLPHL